jgi:hypothetical protein
MKHYEESGGYLIRDLLPRVLVLFVDELLLCISFLDRDLCRRSLLFNDEVFLYRDLDLDRSDLLFDVFFLVKLRSHTSTDLNFCFIYLSVKHTIFKPSPIGSSIPNNIF